LRIESKSGFSELEELDDDDELFACEMSLLRSILMPAVTVVDCKPSSSIWLEALRIAKPTVAVATMMATMIAIRMLRPLLRITDFQAFFRTNMVILLVSDVACWPRMFSLKTLKIDAGWREAEKTKAQPMGNRGSFLKEVWRGSRVTAGAWAYA
jgi:hypothetical protein